MFSSDVAMLQAIGFFVRVMKDAFGFGRQRQLDRSRNPFAQQRAAFDLSSNRLDGDWARGKKRPVKVLSSRITRAEDAPAQLRARRIATPRNAQENYPSRFFSVAFEHFGFRSNCL